MFGWFGWLWKTVTAPVVAVVTAIVETVVEVVSTVVTTVVDVVTDVVSAGAHFILDPIGLGGVADVIDVAGALVDGAADLAANTLETATHTAVVLVNTAFDAAGAAVSLDVGGVISSASEVIGNASDTITSVISTDLGGFVNQTGTDIFEIATGNTCIDPVSLVVDGLDFALYPIENAAVCLVGAVDQYVVHTVTDTVECGLDVVGEWISSWSFWV